MPDACRTIALGIAIAAIALAAGPSKAISEGTCVSFLLSVEIDAPLGTESDRVSGCEPGPDSAFVRLGPAPDVFHGTEPVLFARAGGFRNSLDGTVDLYVESVVRGFTLDHLSSIRLHAEVTRDYVVDDLTFPLTVAPSDAVSLHLGEGWYGLEWEIHIVGPGFEQRFENAWPPAPIPLTDVGTYRILFSIDAATDHTVPLGNGILAVGLNQFDPAIPEPSTAVLLGLALAGLRATRRLGRARV